VLHAGLIQDAALALFDVRVERVAVTHHFEQETHHPSLLFRTADSREIHYVFRNRGNVPHWIAPIGAEKEVDHRFSKKVVDRGGGDLVFLDAGTCWEAMHLGILEASVDLHWVLRRAPPEPAFLKALRRMFDNLRDGKSPVPLDKWRVGNLLRTMSREVDDMRKVPGVSGEILANLREQTAILMQLFEEAEDRHYIPLVQLDGPIMPDSGFEVNAAEGTATSSEAAAGGSWLHFVAHVEPALFDCNPQEGEADRKGWARVRWFADHNLTWKTLRDLAWWSHRQVVVVPLPPAAPEVQVRVVVPEGMVCKGALWPRYGIEFSMDPSTKSWQYEIERERRTRWSERTAEIPVLQPKTKNLSSSATDLRFVFYKAEIEEWQATFLGSFEKAMRDLRQKSQDADSKSMKLVFPDHELTRRRFVIRFRERIYNYAISASTLIAVPLLLLAATSQSGHGFLTGLPPLAYLGMVGAVWLRAGESQRHYVVLRLALGLLSAVVLEALRPLGFLDAVSQILHLWGWI
jgi:hypothetical protein